MLSTNGGTTDVALESSGSGEDPSTGPASDAESSGDAASGGGEDSSSSGGEGTGSDTGDDTTTTTTGSGDPSTGEPNLCGNGAIDPGEECDGPVLGVESCAEVDAIYTDGEPACDAGCKLDVSGCQACEAPAIVPCDDQSDHFLNALELGCDDIVGFDAKNAVPVDKNNSLMTSPDVEAHRVIQQFGDDPAAWAPRAGTRALLISTGGLAAPVDGVLTMPPGSAQNGLKNLNGNPDGGLPGNLHLKMQDGGDPAFTGCDGANDCSNTLFDQWTEGNPKSVYDVLSMTLTLAVPAGTHGFALDLAYFTAHFPEHNGTYYNDVTVIWAQSERYVGNVSYLLDGKGTARPLSLPALAKAGWMTHDGATDPLLAGTGYDGPVNAQGGATDWLTVTGPAAPGETLTLEITVFDFQDMFRDTALLLDNFRWSCAGCEPGVDCGVALAQ